LSNFQELHSPEAVVIHEDQNKTIYAQRHKELFDGFKFPLCQHLCLLFCKANEMIIPPWLVLFSSAELFFLLMRKKDIEILLKTKSQREPEEQYQVERGLLRSLLIEGILFTPASAALMLPLALLILMWLESWLTTFPKGSIIVYAGIGMTSYQFPFAVINRLITTRALRILPRDSLVPADDIPPPPPPQRPTPSQDDQQDRSK